MGEDCSFLVAFAAAPRVSRPPSVLVMWLLPLAVAMALIALGADGYSCEDAFGTPSFCSTNCSPSNTSSVGTGRTSRSTATINIEGQGAATTEKVYGGSGSIAGVSASSYGSHGTTTTLKRLSSYPRRSCGGSNELAGSDTGDGSGVLAGHTLCRNLDSEGRRNGERHEGRYSGGGGRGGGVDWCERGAAEDKDSVNIPGRLSEW